jgi:hypothetical protein
MKKTYINNSYFMEFVDEIATQLTELNFHEETFEMDNKRDELGFTPESLEFYNDRYDEVERMVNKIMGVYSDNVN